MNYNNLENYLNIKLVSETDTVGSFTISGLYPGFGLTIANSLRRALLSSLPGSAITHIKIQGADHEFTTLPNVIEDMIEISLNFKKVRFQMFTDEAQVLSLKVKGEKQVTAGDIKVNSNIKVINPDQPIATLTTKGAELDIEITVERGLGYITAQDRKDKKLEIGVIAIDSLFSPVTKVNHVIENVRVGDRTDFNQINIEITTDGTVKPSEAISYAANLLKDHFSKISETFDSDNGSLKVTKKEEVVEEEKVTDEPVVEEETTPEEETKEE